MTVLMTLRVTGDGRQMEAFATENSTMMSEILQTAKRHGVISHRFYANDTEILVVDRWPSEEAFNAFFTEESPRIQQLMAHAEVRAEPSVTFWRALETGDEID
jgi:heme-degrading monooxygenase HmoA